MKQKLTKEDLKENFQIAIEEGYEFVGVSFFIEGFPEREVIINGRANFQSKLQYYLDTYDEDLNHKYSKTKVQITDFTLGSSYDDIGMYFQ